VTDAERSGRPSTSTSDDKQEQARTMILDDRRTTIRGIATRLDISQGSAHTKVHNIHGYHKVCARWVPKHLTEEHKRNPLNISSRLLERYHNEDEHFLNTWIHHYDPESKHQIMQWKHSSSPSSKKFLTQPSAGKVLFTGFWDQQGPILEYY
jgi:hypothetical protein